MHVVINGEKRELQDGTTLPALLADLGLAVGSVVVEHNGVALLRSEAVNAVVNDGDVIELVKAVAGG